MKKNIYKLITQAKQSLFALAFVAFGSALQAQTTYTFSYTGSMQTLTVGPGSYSIQAWGGYGGWHANDINNYRGRGGYATGSISVTSPTTLYIAVGGAGGVQTSSTVPGGWNGGGNAKWYTYSYNGGGGASHVATANGILSSLVSNTPAILIVAGGGGGSCTGITPGDGGALNGGNSTRSGCTGGTQTTPGNSSVAGGNALFGQGWDGTPTGGSYGAGGGGWYGGGCESGGSSYIGGVSSGATYSFTQTGYVAKPTTSADGIILITELCNFSLYAANVTNSLNPTLCSGQSATLMTNAINNYSWSTGATSSSLVVTPAASTVYALTALSPSNCTTQRSISITVSAGLPVLSISNPSPNICLGRAITLTASGALSYTWTNPGVVNGQTFAPTATAQYTVTGTNGCGTGSAVTGVTVAPLAVTASTSPTLVCEGYTATLTAQSSVNGYTWQPNGPITGSMAVVAPFSTTIYTVTASDGTCAGTQTVLVTTKTTPSISITPTLFTICQGEVITISANGAGSGGSYSWTPGNATTASFTASPATSTVYAVSGTNSLNCSASAQVPVVVVLPLPLNVSASSTLVCTGATVNLSANGSNSYSWTNGPGTPNYLINPTSAIAVYTVTGYNTTNTCTATRTIAIAALIPNVTVTSPVNMCAGGSATVTATGANTYTWNGTNMGPTNVFVAAPAQTTTFVLIANTSSLSTNCISTKSAVVNVNPNPTVSIALTKTTTICKGNTNTLTASGAVSYTWASNSSTATAITVSPNVTTNYSVTGSDANGCVNGFEVQLKVSNCNGIQEQSNFANIAVYPNPNNGQFFVKSETAVTLTLINAIGQHIKTIDLNADNGFSVEVSGLAKGVYYLSAENGAEQTYYSKLVVN